MLFFVGMVAFVSVAMAEVEPGKDVVRSSGDAGLKGLYDMTSSFINDVQSYTIDDLIHNYNIEKFQDFGTAFDISEWQEWTNHILGFLVCVVVGVVFIVVIVIVGCCYCCCRTCCGGCCCNACTSKAKKSTRPGKAWTMTCSGLALASSIIMFAMVICSYQSAGILTDELEGRAFGDISTAIREAEGFAHSTADDIDDLIIKELKLLNVSSMT